jgi:hypothetical protein
MTMTQTTPDPAQVLAEALISATEPHGGMQVGLTEHAQEVAGTLIAAIRANTTPGAKLRAALGVEVTGTTRMGKNIQAAMDAYTTPNLS